MASFLDELESERANGARSRNVRLAGIRSFFRYAALEAPEHSALIQRVLAIPNKRHTRPLIDFLVRPEIEALLAAPDRFTWVGQRDHAFLLVAMQTGLRLSELTGLRQQDVSLGTGAHVRCQGKGRKQRATPLTKPTARVVAEWIERIGKDDSAFLFPSARGGRLSADAAQSLVARHVGRKNGMSLPHQKASDPSCAKTHGGDGIAPSRRGSRAHCDLAGSRIRGNYAGLPGRKPPIKRGNPCQNPSG